MTHKLLILVLIVCGLFIAALAFLEGRLMLLALPFLVYLVVAWIGLPEDLGLYADRQIERTSVTAEEPVNVRVVVRNYGRDLVNLLLEDDGLSSLSLVEKEPRQRLALASGETAEVRYTVKCTRGIHTWNHIRASASDPLGVFAFERQIPAPGEVFVLPKPLHLRPMMLKPGATLPIPGPISARKPGSGTDIFGVREYHAGDPLCQINWKLAARRPPKLFTNEYEREEIADFGLIIDARRLTSADDVEDSLFEYSVSAAASLAENFLRSGNRVSLLIFGKKILTAFPGCGKGQLRHVLKKLAIAQLDGNLSLAKLEYFPTRLFPSRSMIVIFSASYAGEIDAYARLRAFGYDVMLIAPDPIDLEFRLKPQREADVLAYRAARIERVLFMKRLLEIGVRVVDWQVDQPLEPLLRRQANGGTHRLNIHNLS